MALFRQKLIVPAPSQPAVQRRDLIGLLEHAIRNSRVVVVAAPAGWGKTTAVSQWCDQTSMPVAWYTLDGVDRDPFSFLSYLLHSIAPFAPGTGECEARLGVATPAELAPLTQDIAHLIASAPAEFALVLDDFHELSDIPSLQLPGNAQTLDLVAVIAEYAENCHLVLVSRSVPQLRGLVRLVAQQRAAVFDYNTLQFRPEDIQQLALLHNLQLTDQQAGQIAERSGGWAAGIALALDHSGPQGIWPADLAHAADTLHMFQYFAEQVIAPLDPELQLFLEDTSVLDDFSAARCDMLRDRSDSARLLDEVSRRGLIVRRAGWLSYHSLLRDFLRTRLARDPRRRRALLQRAGDLYAAEDDIERAIDCYLDTGATDLAIGLLRRVAPSLRQHARQATLLKCFERLGRARRLLPPDLLLMQARVYCDLSLWEQGHVILQVIETIGNDEERAEALVIGAELYMLQREHRQAQARLAEVDPDRLTRRLRLYYLLTAGRLQIELGDIGASIALLEQAQALAPEVADTAHDPTTLAYIYDNLGWACGVQGDWQRSIRYLKRADACWQVSGNAGRRALTLNNLANTALREDRYAEARTALETGLSIARETGRRREETFLLCTMGDLLLLDGAFDQAAEMFTTAYHLAVQVDLPQNIAFASVGALWAYALLGAVTAAGTWRDRVLKIETGSNPEVHGRRLLALALLTFQSAPIDYGMLGALGDEAGALVESLGRTERATLALLRTTVEIGRADLASAPPAWDTFVQAAIGTPEPILARLAALFQATLARLDAPLARRLCNLTRPAHYRWHIVSLGEFRVTVDDRPVELSPLHRTLLVRLLDSSRGGVAIDRLLEAVWGDSAIATSTLHQALRRLRDRTGIDVTVREGHCLVRSPRETIWFDVWDFERLVSRADDAAAIRQVEQLYRGDFLPGAALSATVWVEARRAQLRQLYLDAIERYARGIEATDPEQAIACYQRVLQFDGCREHTAIQLMQLAARSGNRSLITTTFEHLAGSLRALGASPDSRTAAIYQNLRTP